MKKRIWMVVFIGLLYFVLLACASSGTGSHSQATQQNTPTQMIAKGGDIISSATPSQTAVPSATPRLQCRVIITTTMNIREGPGTDYAIIGKAKPGEEFICTGKNNDGSWLLISYDGASAWIYAGYVRAEGTETVPIVQSTPITFTPTPPGLQPPSNAVAATVIRVIDGDTIEVSINGVREKVRYIGIDAPETVHPSKPVEWMGKEASEANRRLVEGKTVYLEKDISERDKYGRLLRYVWLGSLLVNAELVRLGYAKVSTYPPDVKYSDYFLKMQQEARAARRGLWGPTPTPQPMVIVTPTSQRANCDPSYPTVCIPSPPPDLDCKDIPYRRFRVLPPDPHHFDRDGDGIGCES